MELLLQLLRQSLDTWDWHSETQVQMATTRPQTT